MIVPIRKQGTINVVGVKRKNAARSAPSSCTHIALALLSGGPRLDALGHHIVNRHLLLRHQHGE